MIKPIRDGVIAGALIVVVVAGLLLLANYEIGEAKRSSDRTDAIIKSSDKAWEDLKERIKKYVVTAEKVKAERDALAKRLKELESKDDD